MLSDKELDELEAKAKAALSEEWYAGIAKLPNGTHLLVSSQEGIINPLSYGNHICALHPDRYDESEHIAANHPGTTLQMIGEIRALRKVAEAARPTLGGQHFWEHVRDALAEYDKIRSK